MQALDLNEEIALEAGRMQDKLLGDGERMATKDLQIAAMAQSKGDELIIADRNFETRLLTGMMDVTNLRNKD